MFFKKMAEMLKENVVTTMVISMEGDRMRVNILPKAAEGKKDPLPLSLCATPEDLDAGFLGALSSYVERTTTLEEQLAEYQKQADEAAKEAADKAKAKAAAIAKTSTGKSSKPSTGTKVPPAKTETPAEDVETLF